MQTARSSDIEENLLSSSSYIPKPMKRSINLLTDIDFTKRLAIFVVLNIIGMILTFGSVMRLFMSILTLDASSFVLTYTMGNMLSIIAMIVLTGFKKQYDSMTDKSRRNVTSVYLGSMLLCIVLPMVSTGFISRIAVLGLVIVQFVSYYAFTLSYFPIVQSVAASTLGFLSRRLSKNN